MVDVDALLAEELNCFFAHFEEATDTNLTPTSLKQPHPHSAGA